jgi:hypothetical protein
MVGIAPLEDARPATPPGRFLQTESFDLALNLRDTRTNVELEKRTGLLSE